MSGVYRRNKLFENNYQMGAEDLPTLEEHVSAADSVEVRVFESFETSLEDGWPDFIKDFYGV